MTRPGTPRALGSRARDRRGPVRLRPKIVTFIRESVGGPGELGEHVVADRYGCGYTVAPSAEKRRLVDVFQTGPIDMPELQRRFRVTGRRRTRRQTRRARRPPARDQRLAKTVYVPFVAKTVPTSTGRASRRATSATAAAGTPGKGALPRPAPLRTGRARFPGKRLKQALEVSLGGKRCCWRVAGVVWLATSAVGVGESGSVRFIASGPRSSGSRDVAR